MLRSVFWIALFYGLTRMLCADTDQHAFLYGAIFALSGALLAFFDETVSD